MTSTLVAVLHRRPALVLLAAAALTAGCARPRPHNLLIVSVDTLRADALGVAGWPTARTPVIDRLAADGTYFTDATTPLPRTTPGLASMLTGRWPHGHGSREVGDAIADGVPTLAEILARRGFTTLAVSANDSAGPKQHLDRGFARFVTYGDLIAAYPDGLYRDLTDATPDHPGWAEATTAAALELMRSAPRDRPYFLWLFYFDPHFMYRPPSPWQDGVEGRRCLEVYDRFRVRQHEAGQLFSNVGGVAAPAVADCRRLYDAEIAYTDDQIGVLLSALRRDGRLDDTLVVFLADHGENFGEGGLYFEHGDNVHDAGLRVPLIFSGPGVAAGRRDVSPTSLVDVLPTVLSRLGFAADLPAAVDGVDLDDRLDPGRRPGVDRQRVVFAESGTAMWNEAVENLTTGRTWWRVCLNDERWSLCQIPHERPGAFLVYDHRADPALSRDVAAEHPEVVARLQPAWARWPPESGRQLAAHGGRFKLVGLPRLSGGYAYRLFDLAADPAESRDVSAEHPRLAAAFTAALEAWAAEAGKPPSDRPRDPELERTLRSLGYVR